MKFKPYVTIQESLSIVGSQQQQHIIIIIDLAGFPVEYIWFIYFFNRFLNITDPGFPKSEGLSEQHSGKAFTSVQLAYCYLKQVSPEGGLHIRQQQHRSRLANIGKAVYNVQNQNNATSIFTKIEGCKLATQKKLEKILIQYIEISSYKPMRIYTFSKVKWRILCFANL